MGDKNLAVAVAGYRRPWVAAVMVGSVMSLPSVWSFADIANALMAIPNLISLLVLSGVVVAETRAHLWGELTFVFHHGDTEGTEMVHRVTACWCINH